MITRAPADEFGARFGVELGEFERRTLKLAVDAPISESVKTKWTAATDESDGFLDSRAGPFSLGGRDDSLLRADVLWEPTDRFSLRATLNDEKRHSSEARVVRIHNLNNENYVAYNVLAGNPEYLAAARAIDPAFPDPPVELPFDRFTRETHEPGFPGGSLGLWETRSDMPGPTAIADEQFATLTLDWEITDRWALESLTKYSRVDYRQAQDAEASEFTFLTNTVSTEYRGMTQELHFIGNHFGGRLRSLLGFWHLDHYGWDRTYQWAFWEFAIPNTGPNSGLPGPPGVGGRPAWNTAAVNYVRAWGATVGNAVASYQPQTFRTTDVLTYNERTEQAVFGELTIGVLERLDVTLGFRYTGDDTGSFVEYVPVDALRPLEPGTMGVGDLYATGAVVLAQNVPDLGTISTPRVSLAYELSDSVYFYASYAEGFTQAELRPSPAGGAPILLDPEVVRTRELGFRSDWLGRRLRLNATYFDSRWEGMRVPKGVIDPSTGQPYPFPFPSSDGVAEVDGLEVELFYLPGERWELDLALGFLDAEYVDLGDPPANGTGLQPGIPLAFAPDASFSVGVKYRWPLANGKELLFVGNYGWMDEYERGTANQEQTKNPDGSNKPEPAYGVLNARVMLALDAWQLSLFGTNLTDSWYVNSGNDFGFLFGFDRATIGRPREVGIGFEYRLGR
jgi:outer membrane receptor protein involved in Fe transport